MMAMSSSSKLLLSVALLGVLGCLSINFSGDWEINVKTSPSSGSRFYVLHDWQNTYSSDGETSPLPAAGISDIILKTMGILKEGVNWAGVVMGNLFSRPSATALFVVDGLSSKTAMESLSELSYSVDQTGLNGCTCADTKTMFSGDNVATHLSKLFDHSSQTYSISANSYAAELASAQDSHTTEAQLQDLVQSAQAGQLSLADYALQEASKLDLSNKVDATFVSELILIQQAVKTLTELKSYVSDGVPDVYIFTISTLRSMESRYGAGSSKARLAVKLARETILKSSQQLVALYKERILVQALVLEWEYPELDVESPELSEAFVLLQPYLTTSSKDTFLTDLPKVHLANEFKFDEGLCYRLSTVLKGTSYSPHCPQPSANQQGQEFKINKAKHRELRQAPANDERNITVASSSFVEDRSDNFAAIFLITLFILLSLGLALFATSWAMWTMDPGRDSIIYRQVSDPTEGVKLK